MTIVRKTLTEDDFIKLKGREPFKVQRQDGKTINFSSIFGSSYMKISESFIEVKWSQDRVNELINNRNLHDDLAKMKERWQDRGIDPKLYSYYTVAQFLRNKFFETYPGLMSRLHRNEELGKRYGYIRSFHGGIRRVPLMAMAYDEHGRVRKHEDKKELASWKNITGNSTIQTDESVVMNSKIASWKDNRAIIIGMVHDSIVAYVEIEHAKEVLPKLKAHFEEKDVLWQGNLLWPSDCEVYDFRKDHYYKHGVDDTNYLKEN
jgi:DNA polymerase I-like protein with 3'-5' exonuclease and polymerase domains